MTTIGGEENGYIWNILHHIFRLEEVELYEWNGKVMVKLIGNNGRRQGFCLTVWNVLSGLDKLMVKPLEDEWRYKIYS